MSIVLDSTHRHVFLMVAAPTAQAPNVPLYTPMPGLTPSITISRNGAAFGAILNPVVEIGNGFYYFDLDPTETNVIGHLAIVATAAGAADWRAIEYVDEDASLDQIMDRLDAIDLKLESLPDLSVEAANRIADTVFKRDLDNVLLSDIGDDIGAAPNLNRHTLLGLILASIGKSTQDGNANSFYQPDGVTVAFQIPVVPGDSTTYNIISRG